MIPLATVLADALDLTSPQRILLILVALASAAGTVELIRRRLLSESYAMLWLAISAALMIFALVPQLLFWVSQGIGVEYYTIMILVCFVLLAGIILQYSIVLSRRGEQSRRIVQRMALLQQRLEQLQRRVDTGAEDQDEAESSESDSDTTRR
jgi:hypothetical protein